MHIGWIDSGNVGVVWKTPCCVICSAYLTLKSVVSVRNSRVEVADFVGFISDISNNELKKAG